MAFAVLCYNKTENIGDEIQSLAAWGRIPSPTYFLDRDNLKEEGDKIDGHASLIMNGWYGQWPEKWPPSPKIRPLFVSMHITKEAVASRFGLRPAEFFLAPQIVNYLHSHGPIGTRDLATLKLLQDAGIESYFSGCMTLTLKRPDVLKCDDLVVINDAPQSVVENLRKTTKKKLLRVGHQEYTSGSQTDRFGRARELLGLYARASCVVTSRLHCALPCLAMGTPVLLINIAPDQYRFSGLKELTHSCSEIDFLSGSFIYDVDNPLPNKTDYLSLRKGLIERVEKFIVGDETYTPNPNLSYPSDAEKAEAILYVKAQRERPETWKANRDTFLKTRVCRSSELLEWEKISLRAGASISGRIVAVDRDHVAFESALIDSSTPSKGRWWICRGHISRC